MPLAKITRRTKYAAVSIDLEAAGLHGEAAEAVAAKILDLFRGLRAKGSKAMVGSIVCRIDGLRIDVAEDLAQKIDALIEEARS